MNRAKSVVERYAAQDTVEDYRMELHVLRIGDAVLVTNPFELYLDYGLRMRARSRAKQTFVVQLACGCGGYLPTQKAIRGGHYGAEPASNTVGPEGGQQLVEKTLDRIDRIFA